jgi:hypothetical protein
MKLFRGLFARQAGGVAFTLVFAWSLLPAAARAEDLATYANTCAVAMGNVAIPDFKCSDGVLVDIGSRDPIGPTAGSSDTTNQCENPPYLPGSGCYKKSRLGQIRVVKGVNISANIGIVFLCRHKGNASNLSTTSHEDSDDLFKDIAVIQTNYATGATCFFQQLGKDLPGKVKSPSTTTKYWMSPATMTLKGNACAQCHDAGPFIRTPFIKQTIEFSVKNHIGTPDASNYITALADRLARPENWRNYWFPGADDTTGSWNGKVFYIATDKMKFQGEPQPLPINCAYACHMIGANMLREKDAKSGTGAWLAGYAMGAVQSVQVRYTGVQVIGKKPNNSQFWTWMEPHPKLRQDDLFKFFNYSGDGLTGNYNTVKNYWTKLSACANAISVGKDKKLPDGCSKTAFIDPTQPPIQ